VTGSNKTGAFTINAATEAIQTFTLTGAISPSISNGTYKGQELTLIFIQDANGSRTATWPSNFKKDGGSLALTTTANSVDVINMKWDGSNWLEVSRRMNLS